MVFFELYQILKDGLSAVHVPYSYGFAIILLTVIVKVVTLPLTKQQVSVSCHLVYDAMTSVVLTYVRPFCSMQVESTLAMQNLQPKIKAIQERYKGNQVRLAPCLYLDIVKILSLG